MTATKLKLQQAWSRGFKKSIYSCAIANLVGDQKPEIVGCSFSSEMRVFDLKGNEIFATEFSPSITAFKPAAVTKKGSVELVSGDMDGFVRIMDMNGNPVWTTNVKSPVICMELGDLHGDARKEIVVGLENKKVVIIDNAGAIELEFAMDEAIVDCAIAWLKNVPDVRIAVLLRSGSVAMLDLSGRLSPAFKVEERGTSIAFVQFRSHSFFAVGDRAGALRLYTPEGEVVGKVELGEKVGCIDGFTQFGGQGSDVLLAASAGSELYLFKVEAERFAEEPAETSAAYVRRMTIKDSQALIEKEAVSKIKKMMLVSKRLRVDMMRDALGIDHKTFSSKMIDWAAQFGFQIDGDYVDFSNGDTNGFINELDSYFTDWAQKAKTKQGKI
ncbi:MAG: WD40 repeat domain-containing protein [Candidatus Lokiarchaeota archaeon]|nr:WD40 repeat domain-containing protein [Candidatus Lokiarchaeota archaeon]